MDQDAEQVAEELWARGAPTVAERREAAEAHLQGHPEQAAVAHLAQTVTRGPVDSRQSGRLREHDETGQAIHDGGTAGGRGRESTVSGAY